MDESDRFLLERLYHRVEFVEDFAFRAALALGLAALTIVGFAIEQRSTGLLTLGLVPELFALLGVRKGLGFQRGITKRIYLIEKRAGIEPIGEYLKPNFGLAGLFVTGFVLLHLGVLVITLFSSSWSI